MLLTDTLAVESSALATVAYDHQREVLQVEFPDGDVYQYFGFPFRLIRISCGRTPRVPTSTVRSATHSPTPSSALPHLAKSNKQPSTTHQTFHQAHRAEVRLALMEVAPRHQAFCHYALIDTLTDLVAEAFGIVAYFLKVIKCWVLPVQNAFPQIEP